MSCCRAFKMFCKDADKAVDKEDSPDLEALLGKFVNIEHNIDATYVDENDEVSNDVLSVLFVWNSGLVENKNLKTVLGPIISVDGEAIRGSWTGAYTEHTGYYEIKATMRNIGSNSITEIEFKVGSKTTSIHAHVKNSSSDTTTSRSSVNNTKKGFATINNKLPKKCSENLINNLLNSGTKQNVPTLPNKQESKPLPACTARYTCIRKKKFLCHEKFTNYYNFTNCLNGINLKPCYSLDNTTCIQCN